MAEPQDTDKTVMEPPRPAKADDEDHGNALPKGTRLGEFEITGLVGEGGFGIVYLAYDHSLQRTVALKEYMPSSLAARTQGITVSVRSQRHAETFNAGLKSFINEARLLAQFDHPSLVKVYRFWEDNGTAYMVMPYYEGMTLKQALKRSSEPPHEDWLKGLLAQLTDALETIHREQCFHRDIAPDNIILLKDGRPLLLDFGAARRVIGDMTQALTVILKPGYAPLEQYAEVPHMKQGAWTDIYALAAVVYFAITGKPPTPSVGRMMNDTLVPMVQAGAGRYSEAFLSAIDRALAVKPDDRPQSMAELRELLSLEGYERTIAKPAARTAAPPQAPASARAAATPPPTPRSRLPLAAGLIVALAAIGAGAYYALKIIPKPAPAPVAVAPPAAPAQAVPATPPAPKAQTADGKAVSEEQVTAMLAPPQEAKPAASVEPARPFDPIEAVDRIYGKRDPDHAVTVVLEKAKLRIGKDRLRFRLNSSRPGHLYLLMVGTDRKHFYLLFPNAADKNNRVAAEKDLVLPRPGWAMAAGGPPGINHFVAVVSENPRDFSAAGLQQVDPFAEFPFEQAQKVALASAADASPFLGKPMCKGEADCSTAYGAASFTVEEVQSTTVEPPPARPRQRPATRPDGASPASPDTADAEADQPEPAPERRPRAKAQQEPLNLPSIPGGGRLTPDMERLLRQQQGNQRAPAAPRPSEPDAPSSVPRPYVPGGGSIPGY
jgi:serine/threonine protein kinase